MNAVFDAVSPLERIRLSSQLSTSVGTLKASANPLERVRVAAQVADLIRQLGGAPTPAPKIRNFGWDAVKLADLSMEDLRTLMAQVEAEHANPFNEKDRYTENGQPTLNLYDKKGRKKLDQLGWAVTYKLQALKVAPEPLPIAPSPRPAPEPVPSQAPAAERFEVLFAEYLALQRQKYAHTMLGDVRGSEVAAQYALDAQRSDVRGWITAGGEESALTILADDVAYSREKIEQILAEAQKVLEGPDISDPNESVVAHEIVEHVTKGGKGKTIRGIVRTDLTYAEAKSIDEYTFKKDGGWFIRERHLDGFVPPPQEERAPVAPKPELTSEQAAQAEADRVADEQLKEGKRRQEIGSKLRAAGQSTVEKAEEELGRDRITNTARRANMASSILQRHEAARAIGLTMQNLASAIESGEAQHLAGITSRAAVESLQDTLRSAMYEAERTLSYSEQLAQKGRAPTVEDIKHVKFPMPMWGTAGTSLSKVLEAIKGKRGAPALAEKIRYTPGPDAEMIRDLKAMIGDKETSYQIGWWNLDQVAKVARLKRAGISNTDELRAALTEYLQFREGARAEDPIKKAERAIIGQKVGLDFFPTPMATATRMASLARINKGDRVLEPSAGNGNLADAARAAGGEVDVVEMSSQLRSILEAKGYNIVGTDFEAFEPEEKYGAILMNPPFSDRKDSAHIQRAYRMLKPGGWLVAIAGEGVFFGSDARAVQFREWLDANGADIESLEQGTFNDKTLLAQTGANARLIVLQK